MHVFKSIYDDSFVRDRQVRVAKAVLASCAAPLYFDPIVVDDRYQLVDGGIWANNPSLAATIDAHYRLGIPLEAIRVLSIGTGKSRAFYPLSHGKWKGHPCRLLGWGLLTRWRHARLIDLILNLQSDTAHNMLCLLLGVSPLDSRHVLRVTFESDRPLPMDCTNMGKDWISKADHDFTRGSHKIRNFSRGGRSVKHTQYFTEFLDTEVNLNRTRIDRLNKSVRAVGDHLSQSLDSYIGIKRQGSYALRTIIKPVRKNQEYDADILLLMKDGSDTMPHEYIDEVYRCLIDNAIYRDKAHRKTRCVTLDYADDFHLDVVPCIAIGSEQFVCNRKTDEFEITDGTGYRDWFNGKNKITHGNLKIITRLLKYLRDSKRRFSVKSILLTTLIGNTVYGDDTFKSIPDALKTISNRMNEFLQSHTSLPCICNPALSEEDFTRHWDQEKYEKFTRLFDVYNEMINEAFRTQDHDDSVDKWRKIFGDKFGRKNGPSDSDKPATRTVTPVKPWGMTYEIIG